MAKTSAEPRNAILRQLPDEERMRIVGLCRRVPLKFKQTLYEQDGDVAAIYFVEAGLISLVTVLEDGSMIEAGTIGAEGFVGVPLVLGLDRSPNRAFAQIPGESLMLPAAAYKDELRRADGVLSSQLLRFTNFLIAMLSQSAACNRMHTVDARMARWLLMTHDRVGSDEFPLTQEFLAQMLGVQRPTVNTAGAMLQRGGLIRYSRGRIAVMNRRGLEASACECYAHLQRELEETMRAPAPRPRGGAAPRRRRGSPG